MEHLTTTDDLAQMINAGFNAVTKDIGEVKQDMAEMKQRLGRIEILLLEEQGRKIENLETRMKTLEDALAIERMRVRPGPVGHPAGDGPVWPQT